MGANRTTKLPGQLICSTCHTVFVTKVSDESETYHGQPDSPLTKAAIYDARDLQKLPDPYTKSPSLRSWATFRDSKSTDEATSSETLKTPDTSRMQVDPNSVGFPTSSHRAVRRDSVVSAAEIESLSKSKDPRRDSDTTLFPSFPYTLKKPNPRTKSTPRGKAQNAGAAASKVSSTRPLKGKDHSTHTGLKLAKMYRTLRGMHNSKSLGEGKAVLEGIKVCCKEKQEYMLKQQSLEHKFINPRTPPCPPARATAARPAIRRSPKTARRRSGDVGQIPLRKDLRKDSVISDGQISLASREVPIGIDIEHIALNLNKPLPPLPRPHPSPRSKHHQTTKPTHKNPSQTANPTTLHPPQQPRTQPHKHPQPEKHTNTTRQWNTIITANPLNTQTNAHSTLKAKISHPGPLMATNNGQTVNIAIECGGAGGPAAAVSLPFHSSGTILPSHTQTQKHNQHPPLRRERRKWQHAAASSKHWRDRLVSSTGRPLTGGRRPDSDVSFSCRGVEGGASDAFPRRGDGGIDVRDSGPQTRERRGVGGDGGGIGVRAGRRDERNTEFYRPFYDVLREYRG
ncbi:hypothetical protein P153DRAFT_381446 [Dothidotthia symphoricarpi CBS 119687]|uniref:Uncharacterized protein n=1 Tax=Dothidotthia symphoricarpi CBS 119687 TaxID=1392245 RepID=A0A6A6AQJ0_9PLEO|nr:uncharacterized protein P153DRAFT_381446 [Dothidotthia symphoricarpi CBS 119687]KAF2134262.1 hypothetical protein P153DRAFT_381446 [Dothidotthia symphoricarpi CBS 119687]